VLLNADMELMVTAHHVVLASEVEAKRRKLALVLSSPPHSVVSVVLVKAVALVEAARVVALVEAKAVALAEAKAVDLADQDLREAVVALDVVVVVTAGSTEEMVGILGFVVLSFVGVFVFAE